MKIFALLLAFALVAFATDQPLAERIDDTSDVADEDSLKQDDEKLDSEDIMTTFDEIDSLEDNQSFNTDHLKVKAASSRSCLCNLNTYVLNQYIAAYLHDQPVVKMLYIGMHPNRSLVLHRFHGGIFDLTGYIDHIQIGNGGSNTNSPLGYVRYRRNYADYHGTYLAGLFFNLERLFPCARRAKQRPVCRMFTLEEDGFLKGKAIIEKADSGNNFVIFGSNIDTYGFAIQGCKYMNNNCLPNYFETVITCYLPRRYCR